MWIVSINFLQIKLIILICVEQPRIWPFLSLPLSTSVENQFWTRPDKPARSSGKATGMFRIFNMNHSFSLIIHVHVQLLHLSFKVLTFFITDQNYFSFYSRRARKFLPVATLEDPRLGWMYCTEKPHTMMRGHPQLNEAGWNVWMSEAEAAT